MFSMRKTIFSIAFGLLVCINSSFAVWFAGAGWFPSQAVAAQTKVNSTGSAQRKRAKDRALQEARKLNIEMTKLREASRYDEARPLAERVLGISEKALGKEHPDLILPLL